MVKHSVLLSVLLWVLLISSVTALLQNTPSAAHKGITEAAVGPFSPLVEYTEAVLLMAFFLTLLCIMGRKTRLRFCFDYCYNAIGQNGNGYNSNSMHALIQYAYMQILMGHIIE